MHTSFLYVYIHLWGIIFYRITIFVSGFGWQSSTYTAAFSASNGSCTTISPALASCTAKVITGVRGTRTWPLAEPHILQNRATKRTWRARTRIISKSRWPKVGVLFVGLPTVVSLGSQWTIWLLKIWFLHWCCSPQWAINLIEKSNCMTRVTSFRWIRQETF